MDEEKLSWDDAAQVMARSLEGPEWGWSYPSYITILRAAHLKAEPSLPADCDTWVYRHDIMRYMCGHRVRVKVLDVHTAAGSFRN